MKKRLLVVLLVLSLVLVGCGKKDYNDIDVFVDLVVDKVEEFDEDFFSRNKENLKSVNMQKEFRYYKNSLLEMLDEVLDLFPEENEKVYYQLSQNLSNLTMGSIEEAQSDLVYNLYELDPQEVLYIKGAFETEALNFKEATEEIKNLSKEQVAKMKSEAKKIEDEYGIGFYEALNYYLSDYGEELELDLF